MGIFGLLVLFIGVLALRCCRVQRRIKQLLILLEAERARAEEDHRRQLAEREQQLAELADRERLRAREEARFRMVTNFCPLGILSIDMTNGLVLFANPAACRMFGYTADEFVGKPFVDLHPTDAQHRMQIEFSALSHVDYRAVEDIPYLKKDGSIFLSRIIIAMATLEEKSIALAFVTDITEQRAAEARQNQVLIEAETTRRLMLSVMEDHKQSKAERDRLAMAIEQSAESVVITDPNGYIQYVNPAFVRVTGYSREEAIGKHTRLLKSGRHPPEYYQELWNKITSGRVWTGRFINRRKDGTLFTEDVTISPVMDSEKRIVNFVAVKRDITSELLAEQQLAQAQKMEVVGRLAGGIAHDFNNILQSIFGFIDLAAIDDDPSKWRDCYLPEIRAAAKSAAALTRQLLAFSRRQVLDKRAVDLNALIDAMSKMLDRLIGEDIRLLTSFAPDLPPAWVDAGQVEQLILNIAVNARDAMPKGGQLSISTALVVFTQADVEGDPDAHVGRFVKLSISDTGTGMTEEVKQRIFEPFFTTKPAGKGTGLGLSTVFGIVKQHDGWIKVYSELGHGTAFHIYLPIREEKEGATHKQPSSSEIPPCKGERILLVEDEDRVRDLMFRMLSQHGYQVSLADTAEDAIAIFTRANGAFDIICSDVVLPGKSGFDLATDIVKRAPNIKVLMVSGYTDDRTRWPQIRQKGWHYLQKPVTRDALLSTIHAMLNPEPPSSNETTDQARGSGA